MMPTPSRLILMLAAALAGAPLAAAAADDTAEFALQSEVKLTTDQRNRGISDSLRKPAARANVQVAHESGLIGLAELATVSSKQFLGGDGYSALFAGGYRFGDPEAWHFGVGAAFELFPGASFQAPHGLDPTTFEPVDWRKTKYDSNFLVLEAGYGALEGRLLTVTSNTYRGADTGGVCATLAQFNPDPTSAIQCFSRGDHDSRGSWLVDLNYKVPLMAQTELALHGGYQKIKHFKEANASDYSVALIHHHWGFDFSAEWLNTNTEARELYLVQDGSHVRATDTGKLVLSVTRRL